MMSRDIQGQDVKSCSFSPDLLERSPWGCSLWEPRCKPQGETTCRWRVDQPQVNSKPAASITASLPSPGSRLVSEGTTLKVTLQLRLPGRYHSSTQMTQPAQPFWISHLCGGNEVSWTCCAHKRCFERLGCG